MSSSTAIMGNKRPLDLIALNNSDQRYSKKFKELIIDKLKAYRIVIRDHEGLYGSFLKAAHPGDLIASVSLLLSQKLRAKTLEFSEEGLVDLVDSISSFPRARVDKVFGFISHLPIKGDFFAYTKKLVLLLENEDNFEIFEENLDSFSELILSEDLLEGCFEQIKFLKTRTMSSQDASKIREIWDEHAKQAESSGVPLEGLKISRKKYDITNSCYVFKRPGSDELVINSMYHGSIPSGPLRLSLDIRNVFKAVVGEGSFNMVYLLHPQEGQRQYTRIVRKEDATGHLTEETKLFYEQFKFSDLLACGPSFVCNGKFIRFTPFMGGGDLLAFANRREGFCFAKLSPTDKVGVFLQAAKDIQLMHDKGWAHRDIKPNNFLLDKEPLAYLSDFDLVVHKDSKFPIYSEREEHEMGVLIGYKAPGGEVLDSVEQAQRDDIFSFGKTIWNVYTEANKFKEMSQALVDLCVKMQSKDHSSRPKIAEVIAVLESLMI